MSPGGRRLLLAALLSGLAHAALAPAALFGMHSDRRDRADEPLTIDIDIDVEPEPKPEPEPPAETEPVEPRASAPSPEARPVRRAARGQTPIQVPDAPPSGDAVAVSPRYNLSMQSSSGPGEVAAGPASQNGAPASRAGAGQPGGTGGAIEGASASVLPLPLGRCSGSYTEEARRAGVEGTVILDMVVGEDGRARDIAVVRGLEHGLTAAAVAALRRCRFKPGEQGGAPVAVRLRGFKIRFLLRDSD